MFPRKLAKFFFSIVLPILVISCKNGHSVATQAEAQQPASTAPARVPTYTYEVVKSYPHDPSAFTQGLVFHQGVFYESTGMNGQSSLRKVEIETGRVLQKIDVPAQYFAEGLALFRGRLHQLTWRDRRGFIYDLNSFNLLGNFEYTGEGWGLAHDGISLILSDGTDQIRYIDADDFRVRATIRVHDNGRPIAQLNELEYIRGEIYANIWYTDRIARIDPKTGRVNSWIDLTGLLPLEERAGRSDNVLNGIAYDEATDRLFVTGKLWSKLYEIKLKLPRNQIKR